MSIILTYNNTFFHYYLFIIQNFFKRKALSYFGSYIQITVQIILDYIMLNILRQLTWIFFKRAFKVELRTTAVKLHTNSGSKLFQECLLLCWVWCGQNFCSMVTSQLDTHKAKRLYGEEDMGEWSMIPLWNFPKEHIATKTWSFYTHWLHQKPELCSLLPHEHVCVEQCKHRHRHVVLQQHTQSWASLVSELETQHNIQKLRHYIFKDLYN